MEQIIVFVIIVVVWIVRAIMENGNAPKAAQQKDNRKNRLRDEIEKFKRELANDRQDKQKDWNEKRREEIVAEQRGERKPPKPRKRPKPRRIQRKETEKPSRREREPQQPKVASKAPLSQRKELGDRHLGEGVVAHANEISSHASSIGRSSQTSVSSHVKEHLEPFNTRIKHAKDAPDISPEIATFSSGSIANILKNPQDIKKAILINEVLQTPLAKRNSKSI